MSRPPTVVIIAGPNGAGKSTTAPLLLPGDLEITRFLNADTIAQGLAAFAPEDAAFAAGRIMLREVDELTRQRLDFAFETTLATRTLVSKIRLFRATGYTIHLLYLWVPNPELSLMRIRARVQLGGHNIPEADVRRRYRRSIRNFVEVYRRLVDSWEVYDNSGASPTLVAIGTTQHERVVDERVWSILTKPNDVTRDLSDE